MDRKKYWDKTYAEYWHERVKETKVKGEKSSVILNDPKTESDEIYKDIFEKNNFIPGSILDVGCAWGRMFDLYYNYNLDVYGVDISYVMIEECINNWQKKNNINNFKISEAENIPFPDNHFNNVVCLATFDATYQDKALKEFFRVLKPEGNLYLTGKNSIYHSNDEAAIAAEIGARKKGHPNYFTDTANMIDQVLSCKNILINSYFFERRGDFSKFNYKNSIPKYFYEYFLIFKKKKLKNNFKPFSSKFSDTYNKSLKVNKSL